MGFYTGSIDLKKIDKELIAKTDKNGQPFNNGALYYSVAISIRDTPDKYGNTASISFKNKAGERIYLGNFKKFVKEGEQGGYTPMPQRQDQTNVNEFPF